ncbi:MAG: class I SAM-dependent methyltransferase [Plectolyngbya sp. WJT66-NPBG17]|nr:class I SAM-dependent methyltransferase [Plectolyngbya sp. WJT66-NPBG17]
MTATDLSATAIRQAAAKATEQGLSISFRQNDTLNSPLDQSFDLILDAGASTCCPRTAEVLMCKPSRTC